MTSGTGAEAWDPKLNPDVLGVMPFRGLSPLQESDAEVFFGRDGEVEQVIAALADRPSVVLCGPSGCGKSSLALAGVVPRMRQAGYDMVVVNASMIPTPRRALAIELCHAAAGRQAQGADAVEAILARRGLMDAFSIVRENTGQKLVVVLDQAEQLLRCTEATIKEATELLFPERSLGNEVKVLATLRADFLNPVLAHPHLGRMVRGDNVVYLASMSQDQLRKVIAGPLEQLSDVGYEPGLIDRILDDAIDAPGALPLVGLLLQQLWARRAHGDLTHAAYESVGGVSGVVAHHAELVWQESVDDQEQDEALALLSGLVWLQPDGAVPLRRRLTREEAGQTRWRIANELALRRLLVLNAGSGQQTAELAHEILMTAWPRLRQRVDADREFLKVRGELDFYRSRWEAAARNQSLLPSLIPLAAMEYGLQGREKDLSEEEQEFLALARRRHRVRQKLRATWNSTARLFGRWRWAHIIFASLIVALLITGWAGMRALLESSQAQGRLAPSDAPTVVVTIVALCTACGGLVGAVLTAWAKYVQARGQNDADLVRAKAEMVRAEAEMLRAQSDALRAREGLPAIEPSAEGETQSQSPDAPSPGQSRSPEGPAGGGET
ncbi:hypothetical protein [Streptomyces sp. SM17]|uniref:nSTAND1 domain-containing NTPase n=1 Tax=Streptomyces sp. SM17 TaxID=565560 RepID=UPI0013A569AF|nr:hypothetical protein [Streptomyces sp. SM17]